jgi:hypothetical protein
MVAKDAISAFSATADQSAMVSAAFAGESGKPVLEVIRPPDLTALNRLDIDRHDPEAHAAVRNQAAEQSARRACRPLSHAQSRGTIPIPAAIQYFRCHAVELIAVCPLKRLLMTVVMYVHL